MSAGDWDWWMNGPQHPQWWWRDHPYFYGGVTPRYQANEEPADGALLVELNDLADGIMDQLDSFPSMRGVWTSHDGFSRDHKRASLYDRAADLLADGGWLERLEPEVLPVGGGVNLRWRRTDKKWEPPFNSR